MQDALRSAARASLSLLVGLALGACGGGGGGGSPVTFTFESSTGTLSESDGPTSITVVLHTTLAALEEDATVDVVDLGTGTATAGDDYAVFAPQTLSFPAGTLDGATQTVTLDPLDDLLVDGTNETVRLRLQGAVGGAVSGVSTFTATLTDLHAATISFATASGSTGDETAGPHAVALELDCGSGVTLGVAVSVRVSDLRTGTAAPSSDYASFSARTVTFAAGSADGAIQTVDVSVVDDATIEGDETVELGLSNPLPSACCDFGAITTHVLTIEDDDLEGPAAFAASEGPTGTQNPLAYDEEIDLGAQLVGAGPNTGTLLRVSNLGGEDMQLATPRLTGSHPNDFAVDVESTALPMEVAQRMPVAGVPAPLVALAPDGGPGRVLAIDAVEVARLAPLTQVALHDVELPEHGPATLELSRRPLPVAPDARLVVDGTDVPGGPRTLLGDLQIWTGRVADVEGSRVFLALSPAGAQGFVDLGPRGQLVHLVTEDAGRARLLAEPEIAELGLLPPAELCAGTRAVPGVPAEMPLLDSWGAQGAPGEPSTEALTIANCRLAIETDFQLWDKFDDTTNLTNYVTSLVAAVSDQYLVDVQTTLSIAYLGVHTTSDDGWDTQEANGDAGDLLDEFVAAWTPNAWPVQADLAHFMSGDSLGGGIAYVNALCSPSFGFGVSGNMAGSINWATWTGNPAPFTWDFVVVAHELGHNFGSQHTHDYCPPLDQCYSNCNGSTGCEQGTLMSYCHVACGGMIHIDLEFHPVCANIMRNRVNLSCLQDAVLAPGDFVQYRVRFNPLTTTGARSANLEMGHDAPNATKPYRVKLSGTAQ